MKSEKSDGNRLNLIRPVPSDTKSSHNSHRTINSQNNSSSKSLHSVQIEQLAKNIKLPLTKQNLSALSFALHFQIPLNKETIEPFIRGALRLPPQLQEAGIFSALLAFSKGLRLSETAVAQIAQRISTHRAPEMQGKGEQQSEPAVHQSEVSLEAESDETGVPIPLNPQDTALYFNQSHRFSPVMELLNRLPDKNKQRHIIIPFQFQEDAVSLKGTLRLLCVDRPGGHIEVTQLALEAATEKRQWFVLAAKNKAGGLATKIQVYPPLQDPDYVVNSLKTISDTVVISFEKPESFPEFREEWYTSFEIKA
uniref:Uncharacterized protein n=1 Tax=Gracilinema caldarium TaxID=215591 RepID=A0A7C3I0E4_9SPIR